jgi:hypothetical protein
MWPYGDNTKTPTIIARGLECWAFHDYRLEEPAASQGHSCCDGAGGEDMARTPRTTTRVVYQLKVTLNNPRHHFIDTSADTS